MFRGAHGIKRTDLSFEAICSSAWLHPSIKHSEEQSLGGDRWWGDAGTPRCSELSFVSPRGLLDPSPVIY